MKWYFPDPKEPHERCEIRAIAQGGFLISKTEHYLLTRLNIFRSEKQNDLTWLSYRLDLFETYCLPSVVRQTSLPTAWLIFLNSQTPREALDRLDTLIAPYPFIKYVPSEEFSVEFAADCIRSQKSPDCEWIVTTRLDTDDAIHARLFESVRNAVSIGTYEFLNAPTGLVVFKGRFYREQDRSNAFISASEPAGNFKTVYLDQHINLSRYAPIRQLALSDAWMQIVHGDNIANRVRGVRVPSYTVKKEWQWIPHTLEAEIRKERAGEMIADNSIGFAARFGASLMRWLRTQTKRPDVPNS